MAESIKTRQSTTHIAPFGVRMQPELKAQLEDAARASGRSLNSEIVARLERSLNPVSDTESMMSAMRILMEYGKKYETEVSISMMRPSEKTLELAIKNGSLPPGSTVDDLRNPEQASKKTEVAKPQRRLKLDRNKD